MKKIYLLKTVKNIAFLTVLLLWGLVGNALTLKITTSKTWYCQGDTAVLEATSGFKKYLWSNNKTDRIIRVTTAGKYKVTAWDSIGNPQSDSIEIFYYKSPSLTISTKTNPICAGDTAVLEASAGFISYYWSNSSTSTRTIKVSPTTTTTYTLIAKDSNGCYVKATYTLQVKYCGSSRCPDLITWKEKAKCPGDSVKLEAPAGYIGYSWTMGSAFYSKDRIVWAKDAGMYVLWVKDSANNYCSDTVWISNYKVTTLSAGVYPAKNTYCKGDTLVFEANNGFASYYWSNGKKDRSFKLIADTTFEISLVVTDSNGCKQTKSWKITVKNCSSSKCSDLISMREKVKCAGDSVQLEAPSGYLLYYWQLNGSFYKNDRIIWAKESGTYILKVKDSSNNYCYDTIYISNFKSPVLNAGPYPVKNTYCKGDSLVFEANLGFKSYYWSIGKTDRWFKIKLDTSFNLTLTVTDSFGCKQKKEWKITVVNCNNKCPNLISWQEKAKCPGDSVMLEAPTGYVGYQWTYNNNILKNDRIAWGKEPGMYILWVKDSANNYCSDTVYIGNYKVPALTAGPYPVKNQYCKGDTISFEANKGFASYLWGNKKTDRYFSMKLDSTIVMTLVVTDSNGCNQAKYWKITVIDCSSADSCAKLITAYPKTTACQGDSVKLIGKEGMASYKWSNNKTDRYFWVKESGKWILEAKTPGGKTCRDSVTVTIHKKVDFKVSAKPNPAKICLGDSIILEATSGMKSYAWNVSSTNKTNRLVFSPTNSKTVVVEATDSNGCSYRKEVVVTVDSCHNSSKYPCPEIKMYPNPTKGKLQLSMKDTLGYDLTIEVYDQYSKSVMKDTWKAGNKTHTLDMSSLSNGYYIIKINCKNGSIYRKVIKN